MDYNLLHQLVIKNNKEKVIEFLENSKNNNQIEYLINKINDDGNTPLHLAVANNYQDIANILINYGASTEIVNAKGEKLLWIPVQNGGNKSKRVTGKRYIGL